jgi:hypothetical protein
MSNYATVTPLNTAARTPNLGVGVQFLTDTELDRRTSEYGKCSGVIDDERWFPNETITEDAAREACAGCPVIAECREKTLRRPELYPEGIFAATTPQQRKAVTRLHQRRRRAYAEIQAELESDEVA